MKFKTALDEVQYKILGLNEVEVRKRLTLATQHKAKDLEKSRNMKNSWRRNKAKIKKGVNKWHKSTAGKRFHRALGRFNALRESANAYYTNDLAPGQNHISISMSQVNDALLSLSSIETHLYLELQYYEADAQAMVQFLELLEAFVEDSSEIKSQLLSAYVSGEIESESYNVLTDMVQFFQDPKMYMYAKRDLVGLKNDSDDDTFRAMLQAIQTIDPLAPSNETYDKLDEKFNDILGIK